MKVIGILLAGLVLAGAFGEVVWGGNRAADAFPAGDPLADYKLTLDESVQLALRNNPDILQALAEIRRVHGLYLEIRAQALPRVALSANYEQQADELANGGGGSGGLADLFSNNNESWRVSIQGSQLLYSGGAVRGAVDIARFSEASALYQLRDTVDRVIQEVRQEFYLVIVNRSLINVQQESVDLLQESLDDQKNRFEAGTVPRFNVLRAEVELANQRPELIRAKNNLRISKLELSRTLGIDYEKYAGTAEEFEIVGELAFAPIPLTLSEAVATGIERRAFLKVQRLNILAEKEQIKVALAGYKPRLDLVGGYQYRSDSFSQDLDEYIEGWFFGVEGTWNIFDGFETHGKAEQARARLQSAQVAYEDSVRQVQVEVQSAYSRLLEALELIESQRKNVEQATEALRLAQERFSVGAGTQLDLLDARVALTQAQTTELEARFDYNAARAEFDRVTGVDTKYDDIFDDPLARKSAGWRDRMERTPVDAE